MRLPEFGVRRPVAAIMIFLAATAMGIVSLMFLNLDLMPKIDVPAISVVTVYAGAGPKEVENRVTKVLESQLSTVTGLDKLESSSQENVSIITLRFEWGTDLSEATNDIRDRVALARKDLPDTVKEPYIFKFDLSRMPILVMGVAATGKSRQGLRKLVDDQLAEPLKRLEGVAHVMVMGGVSRQIRVELDRRRLEATGVSLNQVMGLLAASNVSIPGGHLSLGRTDYLLRVPAEFKTVAQVGQLVVGQNPRTGSPVHLKEIARVRDDVEEATQFIEVDQGTGVILMISKQSGANTLEVTRRVRKELNWLQKGLPDDVKLVEIQDYAKYINLTVNNLKNAVIWGGLLVLLVLLVFLRNLRGSLIVAIAVPTSLVVTFVLMFAFGFTLNIMSLMSLSIAIGLVVDDSIVVLENIQRHRAAGAPANEGAIAGASEVSQAVIAASLSTMVIFVPVLFIGGIVGILFQQLALIITMALLASLAVSQILVPSLSARLLVVKPPSGTMGWLFQQSEKVFVGLESIYTGLLAWGLRHRVTVITGVIGACAASLLAVPHMKTEFLPSHDTAKVQVAVELPVGTRKEITGRVVRTMSARIQRTVPELKGQFTMWGAGKEGAEFASMLGMGQGSNYAVILMTLSSKDKRQESNKEIAEKLRPFLESFPAAKVLINTDDPMTALLGTGGALQVVVRGHDEHTASNLARQVADRMRAIRGVTDISISRKEGVPELQVQVDRDKASALGLNAATIAMTVRNAFNGVTVTKYRVKGDEHDIFLQLRPEDRKQISDLTGLTVRSMAGKLVSLGNVAKVVHGTGPVKIERIDQERVIRVSASIQGRDLGGVSAELKRGIDTIKVPAGFSLKIGGAREEQKKSFKLLFAALLLGILLVYMVMAAQFESLREPFIIIFSVPFAMVGALWAFVVTGQSLSLLSFIGVIMLVGIVVKNGIVLIDYVNILRARGKTVAEAVQEGGRHRLRPVLMTAITTICGMLPLALARGEGAEIWNGMAIVVIGGLMVSTVITLIFAPILYSVFEQGRERRLQRKRADRHQADVQASEEVA